MKKIKCPMCNERFTKIDSLYSHMDDDHGDDIPKDMSPAQYAYMLRTGKTHGTCIVCKKDTGWNENTGKYKRFCEDKKCKEKYREQFKARMIGKYGKTTLLNDPEHQKKMLSHRHISGEYKWSDGTVKTYTGSYELDFLKMLDIFMQFDSSDIITPSPHTYYYTYKNEKKFYIPDAYIPSLNLEIEVKDGGNNPNTHHKIQEIDKVKERLKDDVMKSQTNVDYIKIVNKNYDEFFTYLLNKKIEDMDTKDVKFSSNVVIASESSDYEFIDCTFEDLDIMEESLDLTKKYKAVFIILTEGHTPIVSDGIRYFTNSTYTHVSIAFDHILNEIYSFNFRKEGFGFVKETKDYFKSNMITIYSFFVPIDGYEKMKATVMDFKNHSTLFDFRIFANKMLKINKKVSDDKYKQVCSTFVDTVLKAADINLFDGNELPAPADFFTAAENKKTKIFKVYKGLIKDYNPKAVYKRIYRYMHNKKTKDIYASESVSVVNEAFGMVGSDLYLYYENWGTHKTDNILWVTGFSGSGKTTLVNKIKTDKDIVIHLDDIFELEPLDKIFADDTDLYKYINERVSGYNKLVEMKNGGQEFKSYENTVAMIMILKHCLQYAEMIYPNKRMIIEGFQIYDHIPSNMMYKKPLIIKGTPAVLSAFRAYKRDAEKDLTVNVYDTLKYHLKWYKYEKEKLDLFTRLMKI